MSTFTAPNMKQYRSLLPGLWASVRPQFVGARSPLQREVIDPMRPHVLVVVEATRPRHCYGAEIAACFIEEMTADAKDDPGA